MISMERINNSNQSIRQPTASLLFDSGCFMVTPKGAQLFKRSRIESFADLIIFDSIPSERRTKRNMNNWIAAKNRAGQ